MKLVETIKFPKGFEPGTQVQTHWGEEFIGTVTAVQPKDKGVTSDGSPYIWVNICEHEPGEIIDPESPRMTKVNGAWEVKQRSRTWQPIDQLMRVEK